MKTKSTIKSPLFATKYSHSYGVKQKVNVLIEIVLNLGRKRKNI